ncbi:hypothetical protein IFM89_021728 [Coptis chinensis]|uniref:Peptidase M16 N-terminal domain-containing protein n=1 Tax=Coptis chinensis TaxID=261450 RepID=A0A835LW67_9MAGN|nr:hypothetical protein IFM89_021728 [Coptis chinensis]
MTIFFPLSARWVVVAKLVASNEYLLCFPTFEAHMEVHVGSIDDEDDEQGIAHMIEHVAFLGSKKREKLLGTGARSNAYTDFHHTVFHIHSPTSSKDSDGDLLPFVLDALNEAVFGQTGIESEKAPVPTPSAFGAMANFLVPKLPLGLSGNLPNEKSSTSMDQPKMIKKERDMPSVLLLSTDGLSRDLVPVNKVQTYGDLRTVLMKRIFLSALHFRINTRYKSSNPPFTAIELDHSDSGREGCTVTTLTVTAEPKNWRSAIKAAVHEVRRLKEFGVTKGELTRYMDALLKDSEHLAAMIDNVSSVDNLDFVMENDALGHTVMDQRQGHGCLVSVTETVTLLKRCFLIMFNEKIFIMCVILAYSKGLNLATVNSAGAEVLEFISDFGKPTAPLPAAIVACVPKRVHIDGVGETDFKISPDEITAAIGAGLEEPIEPEPEFGEEDYSEVISNTSFKFLITNGIVVEDFKLATLLRISEKDFLRKYVTKFEGHPPQMLKPEIECLKQGGDRSYVVDRAPSHGKQKYIHSIKYSVWANTTNGNKKLDARCQEAQEKSGKHQWAICGSRIDGGSS